MGVKTMYSRYKRFRHAFKIMRRNCRRTWCTKWTYHAVFWHFDNKFERLTHVFPSIHGGTASMNYSYNYRKSYRLTGNGKYYPREFILAN